MIEWLIYKGSAVEALTGSTVYTVSDSAEYYAERTIGSSKYTTEIDAEGTTITAKQTNSITFWQTMYSDRPFGPFVTSNTTDIISTTYATYISDYPTEPRVVFGYTSTIISTYNGWSYPPYDWEDPYAPFPEPFTYTETRESYKAVTAQISTKGSCWTTQPTTINSESTTRFTTTTQNISALGVSLKTEASTEIAVTTTGSTVVSYTHGQHEYDRVIEASPGEVFYVVEAGDIDLWDPVDRPFLTEIASTDTRITIPFTPTITTEANPYTVRTSAGPPPYSTWQFIQGHSVTTATFRTLTTISAPIVTISEYGGVVPTPTRTASYYYGGSPAFQLTTTQSTFNVAEKYSWAVKDVTIVYQIAGKISLLTKEARNPVDSINAYQYDKNPILTYDEIGAVATSSYSIKGQPPMGIDTGVLPNFPTTTAAWGMTGTTPRRWGITYSGNRYKYIDPNYEFYASGFGVEGFFAGFRARQHGVMTSPDSYYGRLSINGKTLLTGTTSSSNGATRTTTFSPTYARFHRSDGGLALMPTSADPTAYTADLTAVTYTTGPTSNTTTTSQVVSAREKGVTRLLRDGWQFNNGEANAAKIGGAAGFLETHYAYASGFCKVDGSKSFFPASGGYTEITESTASASHVEFPYVVGVGANTPENNAGDGPFYYQGNWSFTDILND
jgi:hypothetical protein